jgi:hypothetical protein
MKVVSTLEGELLRLIVITRVAEYRSGSRVPNGGMEEVIGCD